MEIKTKYDFGDKLWIVEMQNVRDGKFESVCCPMCKLPKNYHDRGVTPQGKSIFVISNQPLAVVGIRVEALFPLFPKEDIRSKSDLIEYYDFCELNKGDAGEVKDLFGLYCWMFETRKEAEDYCKNP